MAKTTTKIKKETGCQSEAITTKIQCSSRISLKIRDNFYTFEFIEERAVPENCDLEKERKLLWDVVHGEVDSQAKEIISLVKGVK